MKTLILTQIHQAFNRRPGLDGTLHGRRRIRQGKHGSRASLFYSAKNHALIPVESRLEEAYCYDLEFDKSVHMYRTQALEIPLCNGFLYPDFLILGRDGNPRVTEVKGARFIHCSRTSKKLAHLGRVFGGLDIEFRVFSEMDLRSPIDRENCAMLYDRGGRLSLSEEILDAVVDNVSQLPPGASTVSSIRKAIKEHQLPTYSLEAALFAEKLFCNMARPIRESTLVEVRS